MKKNILLVDDSALMRRVLCDIIESDDRFHVLDRAVNGQEALNLLQKKKYDAVVLNVNMPVMNGIELLKELNKQKISAKIMMASTDTQEGAQVTLDALDLGALDFIHKPTNAISCREDEFQKRMLDVLEGVIESRAPEMGKKTFSIDEIQKTRKMLSIVQKNASKITGNRIVAMASSTGGPKALQSVIPKLPKNLKAPVLLVQHMPVGFTKSLADRLNSLSEITVSEAVEGEQLENGHVYLAMGGKHMNLSTTGGRYTIHYTDEPTREGVKPCANYMFESLAGATRFDEAVCVVLTGMGADGTEGIKNLKSKKKVHVISQEQSTCTIFGMPKAVQNAGLTDQIVPLDQIAQEIIMNVGVM
ncbi:MAG: chemotaxis response regulator protein-glutamate methylesterase [Lachnospiraceae bacterium]|nr:chemotaxis response regulator protein-glutamate methylesterase [Lachnospiraceae bacterium]